MKIPLAESQPSATSDLPGEGEVAEHAEPSDLTPTLVRQLPKLPQLPGYRVVSELAAGGMAVLYRGVQESLSRPVAIKALRTDIPAPLGGPNWTDRFVREARILGLMQHENLVHVYDLIDPAATVGAKGSLYIIMELCEGIDLLDVLTRVPMLPADVAALIALGAARALSHLHAHGVLHRDLKPANLLLTRLGEVKLVDLGTAWDPTNPSDLLGTEVGIGTPSYMSPEQALGQALDHRSDQFSLGVVMYQMLAGRKPFTAEPGANGSPSPSHNQAPAVLSQILQTEPEPLRNLRPSLPRAFLTLCERCLRRPVAQRYADTDELAAALEQLVARWLPSSRDRAKRLRQFLLRHELVPASLLREHRGDLGDHPTLPVQKLTQELPLGRSFLRRLLRFARAKLKRLKPR